MGSWSNRISIFDDFDANYLNAEINPRLSIKGIPFQAQIFLSTQSNSLRYDLNTANFSFDAHAFKQILQEKFLQKLKKYQQNRALNLPIDKNFEESLRQIKSQELAKLEKSFKGKIPENILKDLEKGKEAMNNLERIEEVLSLKTFDTIDEEWSRWLEEMGLDPDMSYEEIQQEVCQKKPKTCEKYLKLLAKKEEYEKLKAKKAELEVWKNRYAKLKKYGDRLEKLKSFRSDEFEILASDPSLLQRLPLMEKAQKFLGAVQKLGIGTVFPFYSTLTLEGISLQGWDVEFQKDKLFLASSGGKWGRTALGSFVDTLQNRKGQIYATKFGYGGLNENHLHTRLDICTSEF